MPILQEGFNVPKGYRLKMNSDKPENQWKLTRERDGRQFNATNRDFNAIDSSFDNFISKSIDRLIQSQDKVKILDIAGGMGSWTADELAHKYGDHVTVYNVDVLANRFNHEPNVYPIQGDAEHIPLSDNSVDIAYSYQYIFYYRVNNDLEGELRALEEIRRVLKPGCSAAIDELYISYARSKEAKQYEHSLGASFSFVKRNLPFVDRLRFFVFNPFRSPRMLIMTKPNSQT